MSPLRLVVLVLLAACSAPEEQTGCDWPDAATAPTGVVTEADTCGWWLLAVGEHLYVNIHVAERESPCEGSFGGGLEVRDPIYSDIGEEGPKWTYDLHAQVPGPMQEVSITCEDGTAWEGRVDIE